MDFKRSMQMQIFVLGRTPFAKQTSPVLMMMTMMMTMMMMTGDSRPLNIDRFQRGIFLTDKAVILKNKKYVLHDSGDVFPS
ncbi:hypothetical protein CRM22_008287 [Opisthorchis felineus]|uniref:Uncharacterized protein n=1 Tax=Opisthorchis felineus TaxID=147828 RepID=A0A4S2LDY6_OPIFE|nr:hypothetical protein CRM22_008287 [Opisthorchis felineus]